MLTKYIKLLSVLIVLLCLIFIVKNILLLNIDYSQLKNPIVFVYFSFATTILVLNIYLSAYLYKRNVDIISGDNVSYGIIKDIYVSSNIGKYMPGNFMHFAGRNIIGQKYGLSHKTLLFATILLLAQVLSMALLFSLFLGFEDMRKTLIFLLYNHRTIFFVLLSASIVILLAVFLLIQKKCIEFKKHLKLFIYKSVNLKMFLSLLITSGFLFCYALSFLMLFFAFSSTIYISKIPIIIAAFITAWAIGTMIPGAPGGLGVRESVIFLLIGNTFIKEELILVIIVHRLSTILADVVAYIVIKTINRIDKNI